MKTLRQHNREAEERFRDRLESARAGVRCDECGTELLYFDPDVELATHPPKKRVVCPNCGASGFLTLS